VPLARREREVATPQTEPLPALRGAVAEGD
jgi:hypothetical protein